MYEAGVGVFEREGLLEYNQIKSSATAPAWNSTSCRGSESAKSFYTSDVVLREGMVLCIEPAIGGIEGPDWHAGCFIVEDIVHVTKDGHENLTTSLSKELWIQPV